MANKYAKVNTIIPGNKSRAVLEQWRNNEADKLGYQAAVALERGEGAMLFDVDGNAFHDWTSGVLVANIGHAHPKLTAAISEAASKFLNVYEFINPYRAQAAEDLVKAAPKHLDCCFFTSTGSEATDTAARLMKKITGKFEIVSMFGGFHGRTIATAGLGGLSKIKAKMGPMVAGSLRVPYPYCYRCPFRQKKETCGFLCLEFWDDIIRANSSDSMAGLIMEPYQGSAGFLFPPDGFLPLVEKWARGKGMLFAIDEVQSAYGRTGWQWASDREGLKPDIITVGKGIGCGVPVAALLLKKDQIKDLGRGDLGSTYGGNPVSCAAVSVVLKIMKEEDIIANVKRIEKIFLKRLKEIEEKSKFAGEIRGRGLVYGIELVNDKSTKEPSPEKTRMLIDICAQNGLLVGSVGTFGNVIRVAPPLIINEEQAYESLDIMEACIKELT